MKTYYWILSAMILVIGLSCRQQVDTEKEKAAIQKVLQEEADIFVAGDMEGLAALHVRDGSDTRLAGTTLYSGWDAIAPLLQGYMEQNKNDAGLEHMRNEKDHVKIKVADGAAWVICDNIWKWESDGRPGSSQNYQISFLEKVDGDWKFAFNAFVPNQPADPAKELEAVSDAYAEAVRSVDAESVLSFWMDDLQIYRQGSKGFSGKKAFREFIENLYKGLKISELNILSRDIDASAGMATEVVTYSEKLSRNGGPMQDINGKYLAVWKKTDGQWKISKMVTMQVGEDEIH